MKKLPITGLAMVVGMWLVYGSPVQAFYSKVDLKAEGTSSLKVGENQTIQFNIEAGSNKVGGVYAEFGYNPEVVDVTSVVLNQAVFGTKLKAEATGGKIIVSGIIPDTGNYATGTMEMAKVTVNGKSEGTSGLELTSYSFGGLNPTTPASAEAPAVDNSLEVAYTGKLLTVVKANGTEGVLNFKMAFAGVSSKSKCATNWTVKAMVKDNSGNSKTYEGIPLQLVSSTQEKNVYQGSIVLAGMSSKNGLAVFLKGPKHVQVKYAENNQEKMYNTDGGKLTVTTDPATSTMYDFSKYEMGPGDANQDGVVNGQDFVIVKNKSLSHQIVDEGTYVTEDLDGNCIMNTNDVLLLRETLKEKQDQIY